MAYVARLHGDFDRYLASILLPGDEAMRDRPSERQGDNRIP